MPPSFLNMPDMQKLLDIICKNDLAALRAWHKDGTVPAPDARCHKVDGATYPLIVAAEYADEAMMSLLLQHTRNVNVQDWHGDTALIEAVKHGRENTVILLLDAGADATIKNRAGRTAADYAMPDRAIARMLREKATLVLQTVQFTHVLSSSTSLKEIFNFKTRERISYICEAGQPPGAPARESFDTLPVNDESFIRAVAVLRQRGGTPDARDLQRIHRKPAVILRPR